MLWRVAGALSIWVPAAYIIATGLLMLLLRLELVEKIYRLVDPRSPKDRFFLARKRLAIAAAHVPLYIMRLLAVCVFFGFVSMCVSAGPCAGALLYLHPVTLLL